ncbi:MAG: phosphatidate cytidylyltransferase [Pirellulales bacterium]|nr:phosphatidate cytidylyltransferase [Pirellulales bacterium]
MLPLAAIFTAAARALGVHENIVATLAVALAALVTGATLRLGRALVYGTDDKARKRLSSLASWSVLFMILATVVLLGRYAVVVLLGAASLMGLYEYHRLVADRVDRRLWWMAIATVPIHYAIVAEGTLAQFWTLIPIGVLVALLVRLVLAEQTQNFLESVGTVYLGLMILVVLLSHAALVVTLPLVREDQGAGPLGMFLYLVLLTESNDIAQALWGRRFGHRKIMPHVSPNKTWEGFLLGAATTTFLAIALADVLTPLGHAVLVAGDAYLAVPYLPAAVAGLLIACGGFLGDVTISSIKREVGVKDSGTLLPGQGGILDRIDSLTFTGPLFFYYVELLLTERSP